MKKLTLDAIRGDLKGKRVLVRVDFNVPLADNDGDRTVVDDTRIRSALPTIETLRASGARVILMSHLGRPKGSVDPVYSLRPVARHLERLIDAKIRTADETIGDSVKQQVEALDDGDVLILENTRFLAGETKNDEEISTRMADLADVYINDAFGAAHRAHSSTEGVAHKVDRAAMGYLLAKEVEYLGKVLEEPAKPFVAVLGGAKVSDKIGVIENLLDRVDEILIGGAMSYTFLKAKGEGIGASRFEAEKLEEARRLMDRAGAKIVLPVDHVVAQEFDNEAEHKVVDGAIPEGWMGLDVGPRTLETYREKLLAAKTIVWNGPMGVFEMSNYNKGTFAVAETLSEATQKGALTVVGGGDSVAAIVQAGFEDKVSHVSTGGGAMLEFLEGKTLPGIAALNDV
jgi:phosphoglycerate kinase